MNEYTVVGGGAIGGTLAFHLARAGHTVTVVDTDAAHVAAIQTGGLRIRRPDGREETQAVRAVLPDGLDDARAARAVLPDGPDDALATRTVRPDGVDGGVGGGLGGVILAVKAQATGDAVDWIAPRLAAGGYVASLQNGLCEPVIAERVGRERTVTAFVNLFADLVEPGVIADGGAGALVVGELDGTVSPRVRTLAADLGAWGPAVAHPNVAGHLWSKLAYSAVAAASATVDAPVADTISTHPDLTVALAREVYAVAAAEGVHPEPFDAWRATAFLPGATDTSAALDHFCAWLRTQPKDRTGIWRDLAVRHRKTEVPALLDPVVHLAETHALPCPGVRAVRDIIGALETGKRPMSTTNLTDLERAALTRP